MKNIFTIEIETKRVFGLDILRALAILFVVIEHGGNLLPAKLKHITDFFVFDGVSIFFVLSGFLIGDILNKAINENGISTSTLWNFWIRRWFRTLPNYFLVLLIICFLYLFFEQDFTFRKFSRFFIFSQNLFQGHPWFFPEAWSLSVEEWFYLLLPIFLSVLILTLKLSHKQALLFTSLFFIISITLFRYYRYSNSSIENIGQWDLMFRKQVMTRLDSLMFGVVGAYICCYHHKIWLKHKKSLLLFGTLLFILSKYLIPKFTEVSGVYFSVFSFSLISIATLSLLPYLSEYKAGNGFLYKSITYLSLTSYSIYLLNLSIIQIFIVNKIPWNKITDNKYIMITSKYGLYWILSISLSILLYKYFEIPVTRLRENKMINNWG